MKKVKIELELLFDNEITSDQSDGVVLNVAQALIDKAGGSGLAPEHTCTQWGFVSNKTIAYDINFRTIKIILT